MAEIRVEVVPIGIQYKCDSCGKGYMTRQEVVSENSILLSNPPKFRQIRQINKEAMRKYIMKL